LELGHRWCRAYIAVTLGEREDVRLAPATASEQLPYDHTDIVECAVGHLRDRYAAAPEPYRLLSHTLTLRELRLVHEAVAGHQAAARHLPPCRGRRPRSDRTAEFGTAGQARRIVPPPVTRPGPNQST